MILGRLEKPTRLVRGLAVPGQTAPAATGVPAAAAAAAPEPTGSDRRGAPRSRVERHVLIRRRGEIPTPGTLMNISETGAAVRIEPLPDIFEGVWPFHLVNGDDIWLTELLKEPVEAWVIGVNRDILRVRFVQDERLRQGLRVLIRAAWGG